MQKEEALEIIEEACRTDLTQISKQKRATIFMACTHIKALRSSTTDDLLTVENIMFFLKQAKPPAKRKS